MPPVANKIAFVVATKDRPKDLRNLLKSLASQSRLPDQIVIVDSSAQPVEDVVGEFPSLAIRYIRHLPPSVSAQRNVGIRAVDAGTDLVAFIDDDAVLLPGALDTLMRFWERAPTDVGGVGFNLLNPPRHRGSKLAYYLADRFGIYSRKLGDVSSGGLHSPAHNLREDQQVRWFSSCCCYRTDILKESAFDEFFDGYSYLEDLDFSYQVGKRYRLFILAGAGFNHYPSPGGRVSRFRFGQVEVRNRLYFVKKHGLSLWRCRLALLIVLARTVGFAFRSWDRAEAERAAGNICGLFRYLLCRGLPIRGQVE